MKAISNELIAAAQAGDQSALEAVLIGIQDKMYHLSLRVLANPDDALEATQEILILILTKLSTFRGESAFSTWAYRVASNHLLGAKKLRDRDPGLTFDLFKADLETGLVADPPAAPDEALMLNELRISCTMAMLLCLDFNHRLAYVLGDILEFDHVEAAAILEITPDNYRKRLSRARKDVIAFTSTSCGVVSKTAKCNCRSRLPAAIAAGRVRRDGLAHADDRQPNYQKVVADVETMVGDLKTLKLQRSVPEPAFPQNLLAQIAGIVSLPH
ncbi:RNA polymerase sigma factor [Roseibium polysiphoniae]|uniref:RNA polymerase sigma factor n=1 Tax=Roseibium polysiphoniae TaxID=2571221 RepID=A0A944GV41_9HYPH|nr:RNA polymerase sigma factor [Roseibium polysiphoniae]MBS8262326.1 RNA polymerase sigma factor [Roseibium polysiphoniae]